MNRLAELEPAPPVVRYEYPTPGDLLHLDIKVRFATRNCVTTVSSQAPRPRLLALATALVPTVGYANVSKLARRSVNEGRPLLAIMEESGILSQAEAMTALEKA